MRTRPLGSERTVTAIGAGDVSLAIAAARGVDSRDVERGLNTAIELGLTIVDVHAEPDAERLVGDVIRTQRARDRVVTAITVPIVTPHPGTTLRDTLLDRLPPVYVQAQVEATLRATRLDALPLAQLPLRAAWRGARGYAELVGTCARLVHEGKVLAWGVTVDDADLIAPPAVVPRDRDEPVPPPVLPAIAFTTEPWLVALHAPFSLCERTAEPLLVAAAAREQPLAILARRPLAGGALAGILGPGVRFVPRDDRQDLELTVLERFATFAARLSPLVRTTPPAARASELSRGVLERGKRPEHVECTTLAELALRFVVDRGVIALPRLHRHANVLDSLVALAAPPLSAALVARILDDKH